MRLDSVSIKNFRCYGTEVTIPIADLTTFVGKNDVGKSSVLEALEVFFNNDTVKVAADDAHVFNTEKKISITCEFSDLPATLTLDAGAETTLAGEYLLTKEGTLKIRKVYDCKTKTVGVEVFALAHHPTAKSVEGLLDLKEKELQQRVKDGKLAVALKGNPGMRKALWAAESDLALAECVIPLSKAKEDSKRIWEQLENYLPMFALFQSDRSSRDSDGEVQDPMKAAVAAAIAEMHTEISLIQDRVRAKAEEIAKGTHAVLQTIAPDLAKELIPQFTPPAPSKWTGLFGVGLDTEDGIPLNKRGSGVRRLVLVSFFKAAADRRAGAAGNSGAVIYAIEEPETAQHPNNQRILIESFKSLAGNPCCQVILTTHSPGFAAELPTDSIRFIRRDDAGKTRVDSGVDVFGPVAETLGLVADSRVRVLICVEGPHDVSALRCLSRALHLDDATLVDLSADPRVAFVALGGGNLTHWVAEHYLRALGKPEVHIYDSDVAKYGVQVAAVNARTDGSWAVQTLKHEIESYLHADAIYEAFGVHIVVADHLDANGHAVPRIFATAYSAAQGFNGLMKDEKSKRKLADEAFPRMTAARIRERDPAGEIEGWLRRLGGML